MKKNKTRGNTNTSMLNIIKMQASSNITWNSSSKASLCSMSSLLAYQKGARYACKRNPRDEKAHQQANLNLTELPVHQLPELMRLNAEKGRHLFYGGLKSHLVAGSSSQAALPQAPPSNTADEPMADPKD
ncbi:hypothetical protein PIB30_061856 [Stylosanthes scabra]|uniref:Uncharacterized protein n=1 Tax=Stylosanthes scabra TaxID=79078 RepID=A0ABU6VMP5_9FABA|nr:hypothetical protein [Stylosanthes scabra]